MRIQKLVSLLLTILLAGGMFSLPVEAQEVTDSVETETGKSYTECCICGEILSVEDESTVW